MRNRQFVFAPKIEYKLVAERSEANQNSLTFPFWCSILELVRTHFSEKILPRKFGKAAEPHHSKPQKNPEKNIGSNHILILGEEKFLIIMKKLLLPLFIIISFVFLNVVTVSASAMVGASCTVTAKVVNKGVETRKAYGPDGDVSREYESKFLKIEILSTKRAGVFGNCDFASKGDIFKITGGSNPDPLNVGDTIEAGLEASSAMTPSGVASSFINWEPVSLINPEKTLPPAFHLQSSNEPEKQVENSVSEIPIQTGESESEIGTENNNGDVVANNEPITEEKVSSGQNGLIVIFVAISILVIGGVVYLFSRQRKT